jgi:hypothetical protein
MQARTQRHRPSGGRLGPALSEAAFASALVGSRPIFQHLPIGRQNPFVTHLDTLTPGQSVTFLIPGT